MGCLYWAYCVVAILLMFKVVLRNRDTIKTLAWMLVLVFLPVFVPYPQLCLSETIFSALQFTRAIRKGAFFRVRLRNVLLTA